MKPADYMEIKFDIKQEEIPEHEPPNRSRPATPYCHWTLHWEKDTKNQLKQTMPSLDYQETVKILEKITVEPDIFKYHEAMGTIYRPIAGIFYIFESYGTSITFKLKDNKLVVLWLS